MNKLQQVKFPDFILLDSQIQGDYEEVTAQFPGVSDLMYSTSQIWWSNGRPSFVSMLNGNVVIDYNGYPTEDNSGLSIAGTTKMDASIPVLFDLMHETGREVKLKHVPAFAIDALASPEDFTIVEEIENNEYLIHAKDLAGLEGGLFGKIRRKVNRFAREAEGLKLYQPDLSDQDTARKLFAATKQWIEVYGSPNDINRDELHALNISLTRASELGMSALCLDVRDELYGFALFKHDKQKQTTVLNHLKVQYGVPHAFDYLAHKVAENSVVNGIATLNIEMDLGIPGLREHKLTLRPFDYHRKYSISPK